MWCGWVVVSSGEGLVLRVVRVLERDGRVRKDGGLGECVEGTLRTAVSIALLAAGHGHVPAIPPEVYGSRCVWLAVRERSKVRMARGAYGERVVA